MTSNGAEFDDGILYDIETIEEIYYLHEFDKYSPEYISIGNNNGDYELVMEAKEDSTRCGLLEQGSIGSLEPEFWQDFDTWVSNGCSFEFGEEEMSENVPYILTDYFSYAQAKRIIEEEELGQWVEIQTL